MPKLQTHRAHRMACALAACATAPLGAVAQGLASDMPDRNVLQVTATQGQWQSSTRPSTFFLSSPNDPVSDSLLGLQTRKTGPGLAFGRRIGERWRVELAYESTRRSGSTVLASDLQLAYTTFAAGQPLETRFRLSTLRVNGGWSLLQAPGLEAGVTVGGTVLAMRYDFDGSTNTGTASAPVYTRQSVTTKDGMPLPLVGFYASWKPAPDWRLQTRAELGQARHAEVAGQWWLNSSFALNLGYRYSHADVQTQACFVICGDVSLNYTVKGPTLSATMAF